MIRSGMESLKIGCLRAGVRYAPYFSFRRWLWRRMIEPEIAWRDHAFVVHTDAGWLAGSTQDILQQYLYYFGKWEPELSAFLQHRLKPGDSFIDVGANIGYFSLLAARRVGTSGRVIAIEASPPIYEQLVANRNRNHVPQMSTLNMAAASSVGRVQLYSGQSCNCGATSVISQGSEMVIAEVDAAPLSTLISLSDWNRTRLVKIDVEGAELGVVQGLGALIGADRFDREYLLEIHPILLQVLGHSVEDVLAPFFAAGYKAYVVGNDYDPESYLRRAKPARPQRLDHDIDCDTNLILSREDRREL